MGKYNTVTYYYIYIRRYESDRKIYILGDKSLEY